MFHHPSRLIIIRMTCYFRHNLYISCPIIFIDNEDITSKHLQFFNQNLLTVLWVVFSYLLYFIRKLLPYLNYFLVIIG